LKIDGQSRTWLNKSQIKDRFGNWNIFGAISFKMKRCCFEQHRASSSFPPHTDREEKAFFPALSLPRLDKTLTCHTPPHALHSRWKKERGAMPCKQLLIAHLTLCHDRGKVALSSSDYKYQRGNHKKQGGTFWEERQGKQKKMK